MIATITPRLAMANPFAPPVIKLPVRTVDREIEMDLPGREGLNVRREISILLRIKPGMLPHIIENIGATMSRSSS